jgi:hypothetical protein
LGEIRFDNYAAIEIHSKALQKEIAADGTPVTDDQAKLASMIISVAHESLGNKEADNMPDIIYDSLIRAGRIFHEGELEQNPYYRDIRFDKQTMGRFRFDIGHYDKYELFTFNFFESTYKGIFLPAIGTCDYRFEYPGLLENNEVWMSVTPNEISTMEKPIAEANGKVLTLGCGMGYYAYMVSLKDDVDSVTIIEKEPEVIELFKIFILPQFGNKDKVTIIQADAYEYMEKLEDGTYDYCFADIWKGNTDAVPYIRMKKICSKFRRTRMSYWIEDAIVGVFPGIVFSLIAKGFLTGTGNDMPLLDENAKGVSEEDMQKLKIETEYIEGLLKDIKITRPEHIDYLMNYRNLINMMK